MNSTDAAGATGPTETAGPFPADSTLLPVASGELLLSRSHAMYCRIPPEHVEEIRRLLTGDEGGSVADAPAALHEELTRHGFGGPPQQAKPARRSVQIQLTNACNLACEYCCTNSGEARSREVDRDQLFAVVDDIREIMGSGTSVALLGGEPLLVPWALDLAEHIQSHELALTLFTNGVLLEDDDQARRVAALMAKGALVRVSLASASGELCDSMSKAPRFEHVVAGLHKLASHGVKPAVDLMLAPQYVEDIAEHMHELRKLLPAGIRIALGIMYLAGREEGQHLFGSRSSLEQALDRIAFEGGETIAAPATSPTAERRDGCSCALGHHLHIRSDGALFTCFKMEEQVGDLAKISFSEALRRLHEGARPAEMLPLCKECPLATLCGGGCRTENLQYTGDADEPICGDWRVQALCELLAEDRATALEWPATHLLAEAHARGIDGPAALEPVVKSRHLIDT